MMEAHTKSLSPACEQCAQGRKLVLFVTGACDTGCFYCPLSDERNQQPAMYANERLCLGRTPAELAAQVIEEARAMGASGAGVTGGDPMMCPDLTIEMVARLKKEFGPSFHIHMYTSKHPSDEILRRLKEAGLDEIRFHPHERHWRQLPGSEFERAMRRARSLGMKVAIEVPVIPGAEPGLRGLLNFGLTVPVDFVNLNELEYTHTNGEELVRRGLRVLSGPTAAIAGSKELALKLVKEYGDRVGMHYCSSRFKDAVQLANRIKRRAERTARPLDLVSKEGLIVVGIVESRDPAELANRLIEEFNVPPELVAIDPIKSRVEIAAWVLEEMAGEIGEPCFLVERYPTADALEVERTPLR